MANKPEIIQVPNAFKDKVSYGPDGVTPELIERAEQVIVSMKDDYVKWAAEDIAKMEAEFQRIAKMPPDQRTEPVKRDLFGISHDIKGQGGSFNYQLMTEIGNQLCRFIERSERFDAAEMDAIKVHMNSMKLVILQKMEGDGGKAGAQMVAGLAAVVAKLSAK
jgi:hypothetical protein